jgi:DNA-binding MarR family transcriptional regulator
MRSERDTLIGQALDAQAFLYGRVRPAQEWLRIDLTMSQLKVLFLLYADGGVSMGHLASYLGVTLPTVTGIVDRLVDQHLVQRAEDPGDRRVVLIRLTEDGRRVVERLQQAGRVRFAELLQRVSIEDLRTIAAGLQALCLAANVGEEAAVEASHGPEQTVRGISLLRSGASG